MSTRNEHDSLGSIDVPADAYWGAQTQRAIANFPISGLRPDPIFVRAYTLLKSGAAQANAELGLIDETSCRAIVEAAAEILDGALADQFVVDPFQAGAGTSHHMNMNEVLANRANEILGSKKGDYEPIHPNNHVNYGQSTNDTFPSAMRIAVLLKHPALDVVLGEMEVALRAKGTEFADYVTAGRTHLQDATPITLGQIFEGYADTLARAREDLAINTESLREIGLGGTAVGTGINRHPDYPALATRKIGALAGLDLITTPTPVAMHQSTHDFARFAAGLKGVALEITKIANDLRLMSSGPTSGIGEIVLPPVQPGSSIMPGKVNPVMAENINMVCYHVIGSETTVAFCSQAGQFQLNVMMPAIIYEILFSMEILTNGVGVFTDKCIVGITAQPERAREFAERTVSLATILNPVVGYERAAIIVKKAVAERRSILEVTAIELGMPREAVAKILDPLRWSRPGVIDKAELAAFGKTKPGA